MSYLDRWRPGSFRGVRFYTQSNELEEGIRGTVLEFPKQNDPKTQNMGLMAERFTAEVFTIGKDYDIARDELRAALKKGGPGKLVHRYYGEMQAELEPGKSYRITESQDEGGMARFTIPFIRVPDGKIRLDTVKIDTAQRVVKSADKAKLASITSAAAKLDTSGPEYVRTEILGTLNRAITFVQGINDQVTGALGAVNQVNQAIKQLGGVVGTLVATPGRLYELAQGGFGLFEAVFSAIGSVAYGHKKTIDAFSSEPKNVAREEARKVAAVAKLAVRTGTQVGAEEPPITGATARGAQRLQNQVTTVQLLRQANAIEAARATVSMAFESNAAALAMRDQVVAELIKQSELTDDIQVYDTLQELRVEVSRHLVGVAGTAPELRTFVPKVSLPALLIAHLVHGDCRRMEEIVARNNVPHPAFVRGAVPLLYVVDT